MKLDDKPTVIRAVRRTGFRRRDILSAGGSPCHAAPELSVAASKENRR
jgi:hypothetical protein